MSFPMRLAAAAELLVQVLAETVHVNLVPWCDASVARIALFLTTGFVITELAAGWHVIIAALQSFLPHRRAIQIAT